MDRSTSTSSLDRLAVARRDRGGRRSLGDEAQEQPVLLLQKDARPGRARDRADDRELLAEQALNRHRLLGQGRRAGQRRNHRDRQYLSHRLSHRSTSPNTISIEPMMAETAASMWPRQRNSIADS